MKVAAALAILLLTAAATQVPAGQPSDPLTTAVDLSSGDIRGVQAGQTIARMRPTQDADELSSLGAIRVDVSPDVFASRLADIVHFKQGPAVLQIGTFGTPARAGDLAPLTLDPSQARGLRACRADGCDVQLPADWINDGAAHEIGWFRDELARYVNEYRTRGDAALITYASASHHVALPAGIRDIIDTDPVLRVAPRLRQLLLDGPTTKPDNVRDVIYWSNERVGPNVVLDVTDLVIARLPPDSPATYIAASKQIYASGVYTASLSLMALIDDTAAGHPATIVVYVNRSRVNAFNGVFGGIERTVVKRHVREAVAQYLEQTKKRLEHG